MKRAAPYLLLFKLAGGVFVPGGRERAVEFPTGSFTAVLQQADETNCNDVPE